MSKQPAPTEAEREHYLRDLSGVGSSKPIGYLPLYTIRDFAHLSPEIVAARATANGLTAVEFSPKRCCIKSGALYVYDPQTLAQLLLAQADVLKANDFPLDPDRFVAHIAKTWFPQHYPAQSVIAQAFGSPA